MKPRDGIITAFEMGVPERMPVAFFGAGVWTITASGNTFMGLSKDAEKMSEVIISTAPKLGSDIVYVGSGYNNFHAAALGGEIKARPIGAPDLAEPLIDSVEELEALDLDRLDSDEVVNTVWEATKNVKEAVGDEYFVTTTAWGPFTLAAQIRGVEKLMRNIYKEPEFVKAVLDFSTRLLIRFYEPLLKDGIIDLISIAEPSASGDLISKKHFMEFVLPYLQRLTSDSRSKGAYTLLHICGNTSDKIDIIAESGASCFSLDHKVDLAMAKEVVGKKMCIAGNIDPVAVLANGSGDDVRRASLDCIDKAASGGGFVLMPGCDMPPSVPLENIRAFIETGRSWRY
ncbi:MAG: uroporphyrinogen decarboxylase family protein [Candidatus Hydrothermarchaeales archaeon]